ncbi:PREDICTED: uncharacterized protein LOC105560151 isoform X2 [Vollenhovia emeryi]|uniref:uncharacterized protein LOC105560151 isoform X2 n=1 Tax=Vollenhovia emeryi TaxID=411798 RepID=UPI0005F3D623|nr:PREDICTED: uncharacterized protein LOC105560151 isoform X2 [Vollenhovia emeryi]
MGKRAAIRKKPEKVRKDLEAQVQRAKQKFLRRLQQVLEEFCDEIRDLSDSEKEPASSHTNSRNESTVLDSYTCYRCRHFLEIPHKRSSDGTPAFVKQSEEELNFIQTVYWLKSVTACASEIPVEQLQKIFYRQWNRHVECHSEDTHTDVEQLRTVNKNLQQVSENTRMTDDTLVTSTPLHIFTQRTTSNTKSQETPSNHSLPTNQSPVPSLVLEISDNSHNTTIENQAEEADFFRTPEIDVESITSANLDFNNHSLNLTPLGHQSLELEEDAECSMQSATKSDVERINKKRVENKHIPQKSVAALSEFILPRDEFVDMENNFNGECSTPEQRQNELTDTVLESNGIPNTSFVVTPQNVSPPVNNTYCGLAIDDNSSCRSDIDPENLREDSAYSTAHNNTFTYNTAAESRSTAGNKRLSNIERKTPPRKKKTMYETEISLTNVTFDGTLKSLTIVSSYDERMNSENLEDDAVAAKTSGNKCTPNVEHCHATACAPVIQQVAPVTPDTNIKHHYNLRAQRNRGIRGISKEKEAPTTTRGPKKRKSERARNLAEKENESANKMISTDSLDLIPELPPVDQIIIKSIKTILSTLCDNRTAKEYIIKKRLTQSRNYWKGSFEEEAVNAVLNISDIFTIEKKPNICIKEIVTPIIKTLNETMTTYTRFNKMYDKNETTMDHIWTCRVEIILEFCNSLPICVNMTDYLITRLKSLQSMLMDERKVRNPDMIHQMHIVFYTLNITLQKYRTIMSSHRRSRPAENTSCVADLCKIRYIDKELEHTGLDLVATEKRWLNVLENSKVVFTETFLPYSEKSSSLVHMLVS